MSRVTKLIAQEVAEAMTKELKKNIQSTQLIISEKSKEYIKETIPNSVISVFENYPNYINTNSYFYVSGEGLFERRITTPIIPNNGSSKITLTPEQSKVILKLSNELDDLKLTYSDMNNAIQSSLLSMKTYNRVKQEFPEAYIFLPDVKLSSTSLLVPLDNIRSQLKQYCKIEE